MNNESDRFSLPRRVLFGVAGVLGLMLLVLAHNVEPDPRGFGTHEQLGLAPCYFLELTGVVCPMCGGTTAWVYVLRGDLAQAAKVNLGGMLLCVAVAIGSPLLLWMALRGRWRSYQCLGFRPTWRLTLVTASVWLVVVALDWARRIYVG